MSTAKQFILNSDSEKQMAESYEAFFMAMLSPFAVFKVSVDAENKVNDYHLVRGNPAFQKMVGEEQSLENLSSKTFLGGDEHWLDVFSRVALKNHSLRFEYYVSAANCYFEVQAFSPYQGHFACLFTDVTEHKVIQKQLEKREDHFRTLVESIGESIVCFDKEGRRTYVSPQYEKFTGISPKEVLGKTLLDEPRVNSMVLQLDKVLQDVYLSGCESSCIFTQNHPVRGPRTIEIRFYPEVSQEGVCGVISCSRDITDCLDAEVEKNKLEHRIKESERLACLGQLASSLSLELNQPLMTLNGLILYLQDYLKEMHLIDNSIAVLFEQHRKSVLQIETIIKGLNHFGKKDEASLAAINVLLNNPYQLLGNEGRSLKLALENCEIVTQPSRVLLIDDEDSIRFVLANFLSDMGMTVDEASGPNEAFKFLSSKNYDFVLTDFYMSEMNGDEFVQKAKEFYPDAKFISISADPNFERTDLYSGFISKPFNLKSISELFAKLNVK